MNEQITELKRNARRRIGYIKPLTAGKILAHSRYWNLPFLELYVELCDESVFHNPEEGYLLGQHVAELARRIPIGGLGYSTSLEKDSWRVHALAVWGSCCRAYGELTQAESAYRLAQELMSARKLKAGCRGELHVRLGVLRMMQGRSDAVDEVSQAIELFHADGNGQRVADALAIRGLARYLKRDPESLVDLVKALELVDGRGRRGRRTLTVILHNMALVVSRGGIDIGAQELAYRLLTAVKRRIPRSRSAQKAKVIWVEGLLLARLGITRLAERRLIRARRGFTHKEEAFELAAVSLDLVCFYLEEGELEKAERMCLETHRQIVQLSEDPKLLEAAEYWSGHLTFDASKAFQECFWQQCFRRRVRPVGFL